MRIKNVWFSFVLMATFCGFVCACAEVAPLSNSSRDIVQAADGGNCVKVVCTFTDLERETYHMFDDFEAMMDGHGQTEHHQFFKLLIRLLERAFENPASHGELAVTIAPIK